MRQAVPALAEVRWNFGGFCRFDLGAVDFSGLDKAGGIGILTLRPHREWHV